MVLNIPGVMDDGKLSVDPHFRHVDGRILLFEGRVKLGYQILRCPFLLLFVPVRVNLARVVQQMDRQVATDADAETQLY